MKNRLFFFFLLIPSIFYAGTWSLTVTYLYAPQIIGTTSSEMEQIKKIFRDIDNNFKDNIDIEISNKNKLSKEILNIKAVNQVLMEELYLINKDINKILFHKEELTNDFPVIR